MKKLSILIVSLLILFGTSFIAKSASLDLQTQPQILFSETNMITDNFVRDLSFWDIDYDTEPTTDDVISTNSNLEFTIISDQEQIRKELELLGLDYDKVFNEMENMPLGPGGHFGLMYCPGPKTANDLFIAFPGPVIASMYGVGGNLIGGCFASTTCDQFPGCLINAVCPVPTGITAVAYTVQAIATTDLGWGCAP